MTSAAAAGALLSVQAAPLWARVSAPSMVLASTGAAFLACSSDMPMRPSAQAMNP